MRRFVEAKLNAILENVTIARGIVSCFFVNDELSLNIINEVKTIVSEAITNSIIHGYGINENKYVILSLLYEKNNLIIEVKDNGVGIENIDKAKEPLFSTKATEERAGLGFTIMEIFSDSFEVYSNIGEGTTIKAIKII